MAIPADLEIYQEDVAVDTVFYAKNSGRGDERQNSAIEVTGGTVNIYGSMHKPSTAPSDMSLDRSSFSGIDTFGFIPTYLYFETSTGSPVVTLSMIETQEVV